MISLSVFQKFFGPLFILPGSLWWGFNTKFWADSVCCCWAGLPPVISARRTKITESWKAKCALSLTWQIWKEVNALYLGRLNWTPVSSHSGKLRHEFWKIVSFQPNAGAGQTLSRFNWSTLTWVLLAFYSAHVLKIAALCCSENINMIYSGHDKNVKLGHPSPVLCDLCIADNEGNQLSHKANNANSPPPLHTWKIETIGRNAEPFLYGTVNFLHAHSFAISWIYFLVLVEGSIKNHVMKSNFSGLSQPQVLHRWQWNELSAWLGN